MLASSIKKKLSRGEASLGTWMSMAHPSIAEILARAGYDWVVVETEHTAIDASEVLRLIMVIQGSESIPLVRMAGIDALQAKAVLDSGAGGVLVPNVNTREDAERCVAITKYPPLGRRGVGLARAQGYGSAFDSYVRDANDSSLLMVQIEHVDAVRNVKDIVSVPGIDGTFIGPYDLSMSMGLPGQLEHPKVRTAMDSVLRATLDAGLTAGIHLVHPDVAPKRLAECIDQGYRFIALGTDILFLGDSCRDLSKAARATMARVPVGRPATAPPP